eukprot:TRINITY_DN1279_c0_g1_i2.p1 TRINITY_DN1279_c0_g1~~TRINITY_DN1279_c0_g1_i2.p1  ORF type:complete len:607 (+),score=126.29 TRINITY_DN1279_c0_g1_i2:95-1822(+)
MAVAQLLTLSCAIICAFSAPIERTIKGTPVGSPHWKNVGPSPDESGLKLFIGLADRNIDVLEKYALQISDPHNLEQFGKQLTLSQLNERMQISQEEVDSLVAYLMKSGLPSENIFVGQGRSFIKIQGEAAVLSEILQCKFYRFQHVDSDESEEVHRCITEYSVPKVFDDLIAFVEPVHGFSRTTPKLVRQKKQDFLWGIERELELRQEDDEEDDGMNTEVSNVFERYNITITSDMSGANNSQAVWELEDSFSPSDLQSFFSTFLPKLAGQKIVGYPGPVPNQPSQADTEAQLDVEYIMGVGQKAPTYFYNYNGSDILASFLEWANDLSNDPRPPYVHSISYGEYGGNYPVPFVHKISNEWMKLGTRGVTLVYASGDDGVGCDSSSCSQFEFPYPSSPWITLLGSTNLLQSSNGDYYETGASFSSGGFSNDYGMPDWQKKVVEAYLAMPNQVPTTYFNASGRALPDVATVGVNVQIYLDGAVESVDGTSCSAPIFSGMISLMNAQRLNAGKNSLGWINQILYKIYDDVPEAFYDVVGGNNADGCCPGFNATVGWDAVTGLGTPNFALINKYVQALP